MRGEEILSIHDAMENLSTILEIDLDHPRPIGLVQDRKIVIEGSELSYRNVVWFTAENPEEILDFMKRVYGTILDYLESSYVEDEVDWESPKAQRGIQAIMVLIGESAEKLDCFRFDIQKIKEFPSIKELKEYQSLQKLYVAKMTEGGHGEDDEDTDWEKEWSEHSDALLLDTEKTGLKDFETVRRDTEYEMFYMSHEDGTPYFSAKLFRNIKLICDFDETTGVHFEEDPLLRMRSMLDRDFQSSALQILHGITPLSQEFFRRKAKCKPSHFVEDVHQALMALMLAANTRNLIQNTSGKSSIDYFYDFQFFLTQALESEECQKWMAYPPKPTDKMAHCLLDITFTLCQLFFTRLGGVKQEMIGFIHILARKGDEIKQEQKSHLYDTKSPWIELLEDDDSMRLVLRGFPNGPLFKILDILRQSSSDRAKLFFSPIYQGNLPAHLFDMSVNKHPIQILRLPCPTIQSQVEKARIIPEFQCFLYNIDKKKMLIFNLQNRTAWKEHARCQNIEKLQLRAEFSKKLFVVTLPKDTDFYHQTDVYLQINEAKDFKKLLVEQVQSASDCGFYFPKGIKSETINAFSKDVIDCIHKHIFGAKKNLSRAERLDFIEIFYHFLTLKIIEIFDPNYLSFSCKDALDTGAIQTSGFFAFLKIFIEGKMGKEDFDFFRWLTYSFALTVRERVVEGEELHRMVSALAAFDAAVKGKPKVALKEFALLYQPNLFKTLSVEVQKISRS